MAAFNAVRFRVKPGREQEFLDAHAGGGCLCGISGYMPAGLCRDGHFAFLRYSGVRKFRLASGGIERPECGAAFAKVGYSPPQPPASTAASSSHAHRRILARARASPESARR